MSEFDLRVECRFKNAILWRALCERFLPLARAARITKHGPAPLIRVAAEEMLLSANVLGAYLNLRQAPYNGRTKRPNISAAKVARYLGYPVHELFPPTLYGFPCPKVAVVEFSSAELISLDEAKHIPLLADPDREMDVRAAIGEALNSLTWQQRRVIERRFGLNGEKKASLREIAKDEGVGPERIRQIEFRTLRKLRSPDNARHLRACFP